LKKLEYLAISLTLVAVILVAVSVHGLLSVREGVLADDYTSVYDAIYVKSSDSTNYDLTPEAAYSLEDSYIAERW